MLLRTTICDPSIKWFVAYLFTVPEPSLPFAAKTARLPTVPKPVTDAGSSTSLTFLLGPLMMPVSRMLVLLQLWYLMTMNAKLILALVILALLCNLHVHVSAISTTPAAAARPAPAAVPALAPAAPAKTFSDKPAAPAAEGWTGSGLQHVDPKQPQAAGSASGAIRADKPAEGGSALKPIETIPTPAAKDAAPAPAQTPTVAPLNAQPQLGPAVEPAPPAADLKDVPAAETSGRLLRIVPPVEGHTT